MVIRSAVSLLVIASISQFTRTSVARGSAFDITALNIGVIVDLNLVRVADYTTAVINPLQTGHHASIGLSECNAEYDFSWNAVGGQFLIQASQTLPDMLTGIHHENAYGEIQLTTTQNVMLDLSGFFSYHISGPEFSAALGIFVTDTTTAPASPLFEIDEFHGPVFGESPDGTIPASFNGELLAGHSYSISYNFHVHNFASGSDAVGTTIGQLSWTITAVPEPATFFLFAGTILPLLLRRRR